MQCKVRSAVKSTAFTVNRRTPEPVGVGVSVLVSTSAKADALPARCSRALELVPPAVTAWHCGGCAPRRALAGYSPCADDRQIRLPAASSCAVYSTACAALQVLGEKVSKEADPQAQQVLTGREYPIRVLTSRYG